MGLSELVSKHAKHNQKDHGKWAKGRSGRDPKGRFPKVENVFDTEGKYSAQANQLATQLRETLLGYEGELTALMDQVAVEAKGKLAGLEWRIKTQKSIARKIDSDARDKGISRQQAADELGDVLRYTVQLPTPQYAKGTASTLKALEERGYMVLKEKNFWVPGDAYDGYNVKLRHPAGFDIELQFHTPRSLKVKDPSHRLYEVYRESTSVTRRWELWNKMISLWSPIARPPGILEIGTLSSETFSPGPNYFRGPAVAGYVGKAASFRFFALLDRNDEKVGYFRIGIDRQRKRVTEQRWDWQKGIWVNDPECRISWWMVNGTDEMLEVDNPGFGNLSKASKNVPINPKLYAKVKAEARAKFDVYPSAYANGWLVQEYKRRGGEYRTVTKQQPGSSEVHVPSTNWKTKRKKERGLSSLVNKHQSHNQESHGKWAKAGFRAASEEDYAQVQAELGKKIPPGWTDVVVSQTKEGINGCRVIGTDAKGRQQYWYTKEHTERASAEKWHRVGALHEVIGPKDNKFDERLKAEALDDNSAAALLLVRVTGMRVGGSRDTGAKVQAYGATTLQGRHVRINKSSVTLEFTGKGGKKRRVLVKDPTLVTALTRAKENTGPSGKLFPNTSSSQVNTLMKSLLGDRFSVKDLRTYKATAMAAALVQKTRRKPKTQAEFDKMRREVGDKVAQQLGNTRSMALNSYINPAAFAPWNGALANE